MRKLIVLFFILSSALQSCVSHQKKDVSSNNIKFDTIHVVKSHFLKNDSTQPSCEIYLNLSYPKVYADTSILNNLQKEFNIAYLDDDSYGEQPIKKAIETYIKNYESNYDEEMAFFGSKASKDDDDEDDPNTYVSHTDTIIGNITYNKQGLISLLVSRVVKRGDISYNSHYNYVFDLATGKRITENEIFVSNYATLLRPLFLNKLEQANKVTTVDDLEELGYLDGIAEITPNGNFSVNDKGITYFFNKTEYSSAKLDEIRINFTYKEISNILKKKSPISPLSGI